jgi:lactoylglutathione lyase
LTACEAIPSRNDLPNVIADKNVRAPTIDLRVSIFKPPYVISYSAGFLTSSPAGANESCFIRESGYGEAMSKARKLLHTRYRVNDLEKTVRFYKDVLGLEEVRRHKSPRGSELAFMKAPESEELIELCYFPGSGPVQVQADLTHLAFEVESLEEFGKHLAKVGVKYSDGPHLKPDGGGIAFVDAPEGYEIELIQMAKPARAISR